MINRTGSADFKGNRWSVDKLIHAWRLASDSIGSRGLVPEKTIGGSTIPDESEVISNTFWNVEGQ